MMARVGTWQEVIGRFDGIDRSGEVPVIRLHDANKNEAFRIPMPKEYLMRKHDRELLSEDFIGKKIGVLVTESPSEPLRIREIAEA